MQIAIVYFYIDVCKHDSYSQPSLHASNVAVLVMPAAKTATATRKRNRKRKRRAASLSSSSESSDSTSSEAQEKQPAPKAAEVAVEPSSSSEPSSDSDSESDSGTDVESPVANQKHHNPELRASSTVKQNINATRSSPSPSPPPAIIPSFLPSTDEDPTGSKTQEMREKFRKFWMASVAEGFKDDLGQIQKVSV